MTNETKPNTDGNQAAVDYVNQQLSQAQGSLGRTKLVAVIIIMLVLAYMTFVTKGILGHLEPVQIAQTAKGALHEQVSLQAENITGALKERIPQVMHDLPDTVLSRIPAVRKGIEDRIEMQLRNYAAMTSNKLEPEFEKFLQNHKDDIQSFLDASQDLEALREDLNPDMDKLINDFLTASNDGQESLKDKLDQSRDLLNRIAEHTDRLANATDLTDREKQTRRAIAVLLAKADFKLYDATRDHDPESDPDEKTTTTEQ